MTPKITKSPKILDFQSFHAIFVKVLTKFVSWNVERGQQGKLSLSSGLSEELNVFFFK